MLKIAFVGKNQESKTFCAEYLRRRHQFARKDLADPLKKFIKQIYQLNRDQRIRWEDQRAMYDALYKIDNNIWITFLKLRLTQTTMNVVVSDARYMSEALALKEMDFKIIRVTQPIKKMKVTLKSIGKSAAPGTLYLNELYNRDFTRELSVDYSIHHVDRDSTRRSLDSIVESLTNEQLLP